MHTTSMSYLNTKNKHISKHHPDLIKAGLLRYKDK